MGLSAGQVRRMRAKKRRLECRAMRAGDSALSHYYRDECYFLGRELSARERGLFGRVSVNVAWTTAPPSRDWLEGER